MNEHKHTEIKNIFPSVCLCDPHVFTASDSELGVFVFLPWVALLSHNEREKAEQEEFSQTERGMTNALTHTEIGRGSRSCWSSPLLLPPPSLFVQAVCTLQRSASVGGAPSLCSSTQLYCFVWVGDCVGCRERFPGSVLPAYGALRLSSNA